MSLLLILNVLLVPHITHAATPLAERLAGRILLDVQQHGEAWYIDPVTLRRTFLGRPDDAFQIMRNYGLGITNADLARIPVVNTHNPGDTALRRRLSGRILLQVQEHGEAWYVDPVTLTRTYLGRPTDAFRIMNAYGLGITSADLATIPMIGTPQTHEPISNNVPFTTQAPFGEWNDPRQQDGCEEAAALMAVAWARGETLTSLQAKNAIIAMSDWEQEQFGYYRDTGAHDTAERLIGDYLEYTRYDVVEDATPDDLVRTLQEGNIAIVPINGRVFSPFHYTPPGPERHVILVHGYDPGTKTFTAHDPGTSHGKNIRVTTATLERAWRDYASGNHAPIPNLPRSMIVVSR